jgi:serine/threonine-protein kinase RsbW
VSRSTDDESVTLVRQNFAVRHLRRLRELVGWASRRVGLSRERRQDLELAVSEAAGNAIRHGGGGGNLELIQDDGRALIAQISDTGPGMPSTAFSGDLATPEQDNGRGLYLIEESCDRVEYRTGPDGTTVRIEMDLNK